MTKKNRKAVDRKSAAANDTKPEVTITKKGLAARADGLRLYIAAGRPTKSDFIKLRGKRGPAMTWTQRAEHLGVASPEEAAAKFAAMKEAK